MSQFLEDVNMIRADTMGPGRGDHPYPPQSAPIQEPRGTSNFVDGSGPIFSMYLEMATEEDKKMVEGWKADADGILIFTGLFSAAVASLISVSIQDIRPNPQDTSNFYLANIYQTLANPGSNISSSLPASPPPFSPPNYAIWVNAFLFSSLVISISCALLATLLQQWARRYLKVTQPRYSQHKRARIRAFFFEGVEKFLVPWVVEALPTLLHVSLFLFFAGISVFLWNVNLTIFKSVVSWIGVCTALYGCITFVPIFRHDSPYHTPLSLPAWHMVAGISFVTFRVLQWFTWSVYFHYDACLHFRGRKISYHKMLLQGMLKTAEETALKSPSEIDTRAFLWTFDSLDEDHELERFFSGLPGFRNSKFVDDPLPGLTEEQKEKLSTALTGLLDVTFSSDLVPEPVKHRRAIICTKAFDPAHIPGVSGAFDRIWTRYQYTSPMTAEIVQIMSGWGNYRRSDTDLVVAVCRTVAMAQRRDDSWFILACDELGVQEPVLREYAAHGDSLSLSILIHVTRQQFSHLWDWRWPDNEFSDILEAASKFNVQDTLPELRHEFCALWNQVRNDDSRLVARLILRPIQNVYTALHQEAGSAPIGADLLDPSSYPLCNIADHHPGSTPHIHNFSTCTPSTHVALPVPASIVSPEVPSLSVPAPPHGHRPDSTPHIHDNSASTTFAQTVLRDNTALVPAPLTSPDTLSSSLPVPLYVDESITDMVPLDNFHSEHRKAVVGSLHIPVNSPDPAAASTGEIREVVTLGITMPHLTPGTSPSTPLTPIASTSPPRAVAFQHFADHCTSSDVLDAPSLPSPPSVLNSVLQTESHSSPLTPTASNPSRPRLSSAPSLDAAEEGSAKATLPKDKDALDPPSSIRDNIIAAPDLPSQPPSPFPVPDVVIVAPPLRCLGTENTGDHPPNQSHGRHDIV